MFFSLEFPTKATKGKRKRDRKFNTIKQLTVLKRTLKTFKTFKTDRVQCMWMFFFKVLDVRKV